MVNQPGGIIPPEVIDSLLDPDPSASRRFLFGNCRVLRVVDGDTVDVLVVWSVGFKMGMFTEQRLRLNRINAPETNRAAEKVAGLAAKGRAAELLPVGSRIGIETHKGDAFGRYVADLHLESGLVVTAEWVNGPPGMSMNDQLVTEGHAEYREY